MSASKIIGTTAPVGNRAGYVVYEALRPGDCADCGRTITTGEHFTRRTMPGGGTRRWPLCSDCADAHTHQPEQPPTPATDRSVR